jgi:endonuclease-3
MSAKNRADLITSLHKFVKKENPLVAPPSNRSVLEHMIYGCCLENSTFEAADEAFAKLQENFFDWNEVRVTTTVELAEVAKSLSYPKEAAVSLKKTLHGVFEHYYQFDLDFLRKENLSKAVQTFQKFKGVSPFVVSYVAQNGLSGHSIPIDRSMLNLFYVLGIVTEEEAAKGRIPGLERTIPKAKGAEFFQQTHPFAVAYVSSPFNTTIREKILKINSEAKERFPKRGGRKKVEPKGDAPKPTKAGTEKTATTSAGKTTKKTTKKPAAKPVKKITKKRTSAAHKKPVTKTAKKKSPTKRLAKKKPR